MRVVMTCQPAVGHFHAILPLARAAEAASHEVIVATGRGMGHWVRKAGLEVREVGPEWLADGPRSGVFDDPKRRLRLMSLATGSMISGLIDLFGQLRPDVVLHESLEWAAPLAADAAGVPYAALGQLPKLPKPVLAEVMAGPWNAARSRLGMPDDPVLDRLYPYLYLDAYLPSMQPLTGNPLQWFGGPAAKPDVAHLIQPPLHQVGDEVPAWLDELPDRPTVYVTMGTAFNKVDTLFATIAHGLRDEHVNVLITTGSGVDPGPLNAIGGNIRAEQYIPQDPLLARSSLVVFHSGYLTVVGALKYGLPMVAIPVAVDQPYHAHKLTAAGAALHLDHETLEPQDVRRAVRTILSDPLYRGNAHRLRQEMLAMPPVEVGIELLERLAETRQPVYATAPQLVEAR